MESHEGVTSATPRARPAVLFHYCPIAALEPILANGIMWLSDAASMNDTTEGLWLDDVVQRLVRPAADWTEWRDAGRIFHDYQLFKKTFYIASFSERRDLLSQWRAYANDGQGACIGFDFGAFDIPTGLTLTNVFHMKPVGFTLDRVVYDEAEQVEAARRVFRYVDQLQRSDATTDPYLRDAIVETGRDCIAYLARFMKHPGFEDEREWRLLYDGDDATPRPGIVPARKQRTRGDATVDYYQLNFGSRPRSIRELVLGPKCTMTIEDATQLLEAAGQDGVVVKRSGVPYR